MVINARLVIRVQATVWLWVLRFFARLVMLTELSLKLLIEELRLDRGFLLLVEGMLCIV